MKKTLCLLLSVLLALSLLMVGALGEEELGYKKMNIFDTFMKDQVNYSSGALDDWFYQNQGIPAYTMEFWNIAEKAGMPFDWFDNDGETPEACKLPP